MDEHDKGGALPEEIEWAPRAEGKTWRDTHEERVMEFIRFMGPDGATTRQIARGVRLPLAVVWKKLMDIQRNGRVTIDTNEKEATWRIPLRVLKAQKKKAQQDSKDAAELLIGWTISSICARIRDGMKIHASYPYVKALGESSSLTTTPLTS